MPKLFLSLEVDLQMNKNNCPLVSVIIPVYNEQKHLSECLQSIINQDYSTMEIIIINDGSKDKSSEIIRMFKQKDKRISCFNNPIRIGASESRNIALSHARGKYVAILDADDVCKENRISLQVNFMEANPKIFLVGGFAIGIDSKGNKINSFVKPCDSNEIKKLILKNNTFVHSTVMFKNNGSVKYRSKLEFVEDYDLFLRTLLENKKITNIPFFLVKYRLRKNYRKSMRRKIQVALTLKAKEFFLLGQKGINEYNLFSRADYLRNNLKNGARL